MSAGGEPEPFELTRPAGTLRGESAGEGPVVLTAHGLTAARRYVLHGSRHLLRRGYRLVSYDARGHGESDPAPADAGYTYAELAADLGAVAERFSPQRRLVLVGHSMGAHTVARWALENPERVAALIVAGPTSLGELPPEAALARWDRLAAGLEQGGVEGFVAAYDQGLDPNWREVLVRLARQRLALHRHPEAIARALREVPRSLPFEGVEQLERIEVPCLVVGSRDESDPEHPLAVAREWSERIPGARLIVELEGASPLAWSGGRLSREIEAFCAEPRVVGRL